MLRYNLKTPPLKKILHFQDKTCIFIKSKNNHSSASDWWENIKSSFKESARTFSKNSTTQGNIKISKLKKNCKNLYKKKLNQWLKTCKMNFIRKKRNKKKLLNLVLILDRRWRRKNTPKISSKYFVHGIGVKLASNWERNILRNGS